VTGTDKALEEMTADELRSELDGLRTLWSWVPEDVQRHISTIGKLCRVHTRGKESYLGAIQGLSIEIRTIEVATEEEWTDWSKGKKYLETKLIIFPISSLSFFEVIEDREEIEEEEKIDSVDRLLETADIED
tara:strand:+ start:50 stop:445 length:396 start_codon:yes stop_codon:yes gene_type:complete